MINAAVNLRGLMTSLGAGGSLVAAALCAAVLVGGILAVRDAVDGTAEANGGDVTVPAARTAPGRRHGCAGRSGRERRCRDLARRRAERAPAAAPAGAAAARRTPAVRGRRAAGERPIWHHGEGAGGGSGPAAPAPPPATGDDTRTVARVVRQTREAVAPVVEVAPEPVQAPVEEVVDLVEDVAGTVDETLAPVTGLLPKRP